MKKNIIIEANANFHHVAGRNFFVKIMLTNRVENAHEIPACDSCYLRDSELLRLTEER